MSEQTDNQSNRSLELCKRVVTTESFIAEAKEIYSYRYDYREVEYKNREHRVNIVCPVHDDFQVYARKHLYGKGCPKCEKGEKFLLKLKDKFGLDEFVYEWEVGVVRNAFKPDLSHLTRNHNPPIYATIGFYDAEEIKDCELDVKDMYRVAELPINAKNNKSTKTADYLRTQKGSIRILLQTQFGDGFDMIILC